VSKQTAHRFQMERFSSKKLNEVEAREQYCVEMSNRFTAVENLDAQVVINRAWKLLERMSTFHTNSHSCKYNVPTSHCP
jgi:hypothetical protein